MSIVKLPLLAAISLTAACSSSSNIEEFDDSFSCNAGESCSFSWHSFPIAKTTSPNIEQAMIYPLSPDKCYLILADPSQIQAVQSLSKEIEAVGTEINLKGKGVDRDLAIDWDLPLDCKLNDTAMELTEFDEVVTLFHER